MVHAEVITFKFSSCLVQMSLMESGWKAAVSVGLRWGSRKARGMMLCQGFPGVLEAAAAYGVCHRGP